MSDTSIQGFMQTAMNSIREMIDVNTIVGDPVTTPDGTVIIPISKVTFGFVAGGGKGEIEQNENKSGFGGVSGGGVSVRPVGFLVCSVNQGIRFMCVDNHNVYDKLLDFMPQAMEKIQEMLNGHMTNYDDLESKENN